MSNQIKIGITHGDINGVGYELILKTFADERLLELFVPVIYGSTKSASYHRKAININPVHFNIINGATECVEGKVNLVNCIKEEVRIELGKSTSEAGEAAYVALDVATKDLADKKIDVLVTLPITKESIQSKDFVFPGHTEFLEDRFKGEDDKALMILASEQLKVAVATTHVPLNKVSGMLTKELILDKIKTLDLSLKRDFRIELPRIAVLGLNPHAGENGLLGKEEIEIISPAVKEAQDEGFLVAGPYPADGFFGNGTYKRFDAILAMYHDQGLIPFKTISMDEGVNFTAGLPIVRTSPDHGTAYDIAGKGLASENSFREAIYMAKDIFYNRQAYDEARKNPLKKLFYDRGKEDFTLDLSKEEE